MKPTSRYINFCFKCRQCDEVFEQYAWLHKDQGEWKFKDKESIRCQRCNSNGVLVEQQKKKKEVNFPMVCIPRKHQSAPSDKGYDKHPADGGIPFGEVPGDEDYAWLQDEERDFGPLP